MKENKSNKNQVIKTSYDFDYSIDASAPQAQEILAHRAKLLAEEEKEEFLGNQKSYLCFLLGKTGFYGLDFSCLDEVVCPEEIILIPKTPAFIAGVINRRGEVITLLDLGYFFNIQIDKNKSNKVIIVKHNNIVLGLLVTDTLGVEKYYPEKILPPILSSNVKKMEYVKGIYNSNIVMLDVSAIITDKNLIIDKSNQ